jgi:hypothetical protein
MRNSISKYDISLKNNLKKKHAKIRNNFVLNLYKKIVSIVFLLIIKNKQKL